MGLVSNACTRLLSPSQRWRHFQIEFGELMVFLEDRFEFRWDVEGARLKGQPSGTPDRI